MNSWRCRLSHQLLHVTKGLEMLQFISAGFCAILGVLALPLR